MKLSRKAWNNVLLISAFLMILIFNITGKSTAISSDLVGILPENSKIIALSIDQQLWKQTENGWQSHLPKVNNGQTAKTISLWQSHKFTVWPDVIGGSTQVKRIKVQIAQLANPIELTLFYSQKQKILTNWQGQLLQLSPEEFELLFTPLMQQSNQQ